MFTFFGERTFRVFEICILLQPHPALAASSSIGGLIQNWRPRSALAARPSSLTLSRWPSKQTWHAQPFLHFLVVLLLRERFQLWIHEDLRPCPRTASRASRGKHQALFNSSSTAKPGEKHEKALCLQFLDFWFLNLLCSSHRRSNLTVGLKRPRIWGRGLGFEVVASNGLVS